MGPPEPAEHVEDRQANGHSDAVQHPQEGDAEEGDEGEDEVGPALAPQPSESGDVREGQRCGDDDCCERGLRKVAEQSGRGDEQGDRRAPGEAIGTFALESAIDFILANGKSEPKTVYAGAVSYLKLAGIVLCGWQMARALMIAQDKQDSDPAFFTAKQVTARFYAESVLPQAAGLAQSIREAGATTNRMAAEMF